MISHLYDAGGRPLLSVQYGGQHWPGLAPEQPVRMWQPLKPLTYQLRSAGVTEIVTGDGFIVQFRIVVKGVSHIGETPDGQPLHHIDFEVVPTTKPLMAEGEPPLPGRGN